LEYIALVKSYRNCLGANLLRCKTTISVEWLPGDSWNIGILQREISQSRDIAL